MIARAFALSLGLLSAGSLSSPALAQLLPAPQYSQLARERAAGEDPTFHVNRYGYGNYVQGPNGSYGGYPAGSAGAIELQNEHDIKCRDLPESC